jgi:phosphoribosyl 1,2-cyclic phosphate phosphodiesterase
VLEWAERVQPKRLVLTHLGLGLDYEALRRALPADAEPAYDGMVLDVPDAARR